MRHAVVAAVAVALVGAVPAVAQMNPASIGLGFVMPSAINAQAKHHASRGNGTAHGRGSAPALGKPVAKPVALRFRVDPAARRRNLDEFVARASQLDPAAGRQVGQLFEEQQGFEQVATWMRRYGMDPANLADCVTVYLSSAWLATHATNADPSRAQVLGLRAQVTRAMLSLSGVAQASNDLKQGMADAVILQAAVTDGLGGRAQTDPTARGTVRESVAKVVSDAYNFDILSVRYTDAGFVPD